MGKINLYDCVSAQSVHKEVDLIKGVVTEFDGETVTLHTVRMERYTCVLKTAELISDQELDEKILKLKKWLQGE